MSKVTFVQCLYEAISTPELVREFDRLNGTHLSKMAARSPIAAMIDKATGYEDDQMKKFIGFIWEFVWLRLPTDAKDEALSVPDTAACGAGCSEDGKE